MNPLFFLIFLSSLSFLQIGELGAQPYDNQKGSRLEVQVQQLPSSHEGSYYDNSGLTPQIQRQGSNQRSPMIDNMAQQTKERTLSILKPDAVKNRHIGDIIARFENNGLHVVGMKMVKLSKEQAAQFYHIHRDRPFFKDLTQFMSSGPVVVLVLEGDQAVSKNRQLMGATDPNKAEKGTIRSDLARSVTENAVHGSDSPESAQQEIRFFFQPHEVYSDQ